MVFKHPENVRFMIRATGHDPHKITMSFLQRDLINTKDIQSLNTGPVDLGGDIAIDDTFDRVIVNMFSHRDIRGRTVDARSLEMRFKCFRVLASAIEPSDALRGRWLAITRIASISR